MLTSIHSSLPTKNLRGITLCSGRKRIPKHPTTTFFVFILDTQRPLGARCPAPPPLVHRQAELQAGPESLRRVQNKIRICFRFRFRFRSDHVHRHTRVENNASKHMLNHLSRQISNHLLLLPQPLIQYPIHAKKRPVAHVHDALNPPAGAAPHPVQPRLRPNRLVQALSERDADVLRRVVIVDPKVPHGRNFQRHFGTFRNREQHLVYRGQACRDSTAAVSSAVKHNAYLHARLVRRAIDLPGPKRGGEKVELRVARLLRPPLVNQLPQPPRKRLEASLDDVVPVAPPELLEVERKARGVGQALPKELKMGRFCLTQN